MQKSKKLKILFLPSWYPSEKSPVAGVFIKEHAKAVSLYNEVIVVYNEGHDKNIKGTWTIISDKFEDGIRTIRIKHKKSPVPKTGYLIYLWSIKQAFKKLIKEGWKPDIIHAHVYSAGVPAVILGKKYKIPVVITEHFSSFPRKALNKIEIIKARFAMNRANMILPVSKFLMDSIKSYGIKNKFKIIPNVVNTEIFHLSQNKDKNTKESPKKILIVALLVSIKGIPYLLKALAKLKKRRNDFILDIVGDGPKRKVYENLSKKLGLERFVNFHGIKSKPEVAEFMRNSDFFVLPSLFETFGVVFIEAMACGKPIVATNLPVLRELINKDRGILVPPKDVNDLVKAIDYMLDHYQSYHSGEISQYAKEKFSYEVVGKEINKIYKEVLSY